MMQKADFITRAVAGFIDILLVIGLSRLPDVIGFLSAVGYILIRDGLFSSQSVGKKLIGLAVASSDNDNDGRKVSFRESIIRNATFAAAYLLFLIPYVGWFFGSLTLAVEGLTAIGDERGMRTGDLMARTVTISVAEPARDFLEEQPDFSKQQTNENPPNND